MTAICLTPPMSMSILARNCTGIAQLSLQVSLSIDRNYGHCPESSDNVFSTYRAMHYLLSLPCKIRVFALHGVRCCLPSHSNIRNKIVDPIYLRPCHRSCIYKVVVIIMNLQAIEPSNDIQMHRKDVFKYLFLGQFVDLPFDTTQVQSILVWQIDLDI